MAQGYIAQTLPMKPKSPLQRYRLLRKGKDDNIYSKTYTEGPTLFENPKGQMKMRFLEHLLKVRRTALLAVLAAPAVSADEVPWNTYVVNRTVEVSPGARKNKAFPMAEGSALCDLHLMAKRLGASAPRTSRSATTRRCGSRRATAST